ncbi:MAG: tetratricopeptide repeat protein [Akkermansiaceae bacterium]|jgi:tetratricopeptide (TPR) repeat protein|nr:tetratricopeptide repeat protein [Akkermansiaceae bacterium]
MSALLLHAKALRERRRFPEAIAALHQHLVADPDDFQGHFELAVTRLMEGEDHRTALLDIDRAIAQEPEVAIAHAVKSQILNRLERHAEALSIADDAIALDPELDAAWFSRALALFELRRLPEAEDAARKALELDPDDADSSNLLSTILRIAGKVDQAQSEIGRQLAKDPENAWTFANAGWAALQAGDRHKAEELFREALRLDASMEHARLGLLEAFKSKSALYRLHLRWVFFLQRHSEKNQWAIVIGIYLAYRLGRSILASVHPLAAAGLVVVYLFFCFGGWLASGLGHFLILTDRFARLALKPCEKRDGLAVGGLFFLGLLLLLAGVTVLPLPVAIAGGLVMGAAVPGGMIFDNPSVKGRTLFSLITVAVLVCAAIEASRAMSGESSAGTNTGSFTLGLLLVFLCTWIGGISSLRHAAPK